MEDLTGGRVALVCVRDSPRLGLEVLLRQDVTQNVEAGSTAFIEGGLESRDCSPRTLGACYGLTGGEAKRYLDYGLSPSHALGFWVAGVRLLLAATGVLLTVKGAGFTPVRLKVPWSTRRGLIDGPGLANFTARHDLCWDLKSLLPFSKWVDLDGRAVKGFFLVNLPERIRASGFAWHVPENALLSWRDERFPLDFQTFACLRLLTDFSSCTSLLSEYDAQSPLQGE